MKFATYIAAYMGLENSMVGQVAKSLETTYRVPVIWEHFQECTCCSESFIRSDHPIVADIILDKISSKGIGSLSDKEKDFLSKYSD